MKTSCLFWVCQNPNLPQDINIVCFLSSSVQKFISLRHLSHVLKTDSAKQHVFHKECTPMYCLMFICNKIIAYLTMDTPGFTPVITNRRGTHPPPSLGFLKEVLLMFLTPCSTHHRCHHFYFSHGSTDIIPPALLLT